MKHITFIAVAIVTLLAACNQSDTITLLNLKTETGLYKPLFIDFSIENEFINPYDQDEIKVDAIFETENKDTLVLPCFFVRQTEKGSQWQARFTPRLTGKYSFKIKVAQTGKETFSEANQFVVKPSDDKGLLSIDTANAYFLKFDNGEKYRGLGLNIGWEYEPKWDTKNKYSFTKFFEAMHTNDANFYRMWICPWNYPIEWTSVVNYEMFTEEFADWNHVLTHSEGLNLSAGTTSVTQADEGQLLKTTAADENIVYKLDSVRTVKLMIYYKGQIAKEDIDVLYSPDNNTYKKVVSELSDSWESAEGWRRIFLFTYEPIAQPANYIKVVLKNTLQKDSVKISGIQFRYGKAVSQLDCDGLSRFSVKNSEKLDTLFDLALSKGIHILLSLGYHGQFNPMMDSWGVNDEWQRNPYNVKNGGPCQKPADFFSNETAKKHYKNYLRYFVARWGYSAAIVSWEFWNEIDIAMRSHKVPEADLVGWHKDMSDYLNAIDPYNHIITTSLSWGDMPELWKLPNMDLTQVHRYSPSKDFVQQTVDYVNKYNKPHIIGEYAISWKGPGNDFPEEVYEDEFHDGMWRGLFTPVALLPISWWWDFHFDRNQYFHFKPLASAIDEMKKQTNNFSFVKLENQPGFDILAQASGDFYMVWVKKLEKNTKASVSLSVGQPGNYKVVELNTRTNESKDNGIIATQTNQLSLKNIDLGANKDLLLFVTKEK